MHLPSERRKLGNNNTLSLAHRQISRYSSGRRKVFPRRTIVAAGRSGKNLACVRRLLSARGTSLLPHGRWQQMHKKQLRPTERKPKNPVEGSARVERRRGGCNLRALRAIKTATKAARTSRRRSLCPTLRPSALFARCASARILALSAIADVSSLPHTALLLFTQLQARSFCRSRVM